MLEQALSLLNKGELVAIPTETVYGLAGDAANPEAVRKIFALKGRPANHPLIVHIEGQNQLVHWARDIPDTAYQLADAFWPGPLTLILKKHKWVSDWVTGGQDSVGLRAPSHPLTQQLLQQFGGGLAAPSANRFGQVSPTTAQHVQAEFGIDSPFILEGGPCLIGVESTIVSLIDDTPTLLRPGGISLAQIESVLQQPVTHHQKASSAKVRVSGLLDSHYAPHTPLILGTLSQLIAEINAHPEQRIVLVHYSSLPTLPHTLLTPLRMPSDAADVYAQKLYATLRQADHYRATRILLEKPADNAAWLAINDRLQRAASLIL
jgi:L-threonylcarbamoyladenylate synthase